MATIELGGKVTSGPATDLEGLTVQLYTAANWEAGSAATSSTTTDSDGRWSFSAVAAGTHIVVIHNADSSVKILFDGRNEVQFTNVDVQSVINAIRVIPSVAFLHYQNSDDENKTGNGAVHTVDFETEIYDIGGNFAGTTFTAPFTGRFLICTTVYVKNMTAAADNIQLSIITPNRTYEVFLADVDLMPQIKSVHWSGVVDMDNGEALTVTVIVSGESSDVVDIQGSAAPQTVISGVSVA